MPGSYAAKKYQAGGYVGPDYSELWTRQAQANDREWAAVNQQSAPARQPMHKIAPPAMSANAQRVMAQAMAMPSRNWGEALSKLGNVWATKRTNEREAEQKRQYLNEQETRRGRWAQQLHSGASLRDIATHDPGIMGDTAFLDFAKTTTPAVAAEVEMFEDVDSPFGKGGFGQRSSTTGKISGYQRALAQAKPTPRPTAKDQHGRLRYLDDGAPAFSDEQLGPAPEPPPPEGPSQKDRLAMARQLSSDWMITAKPMQALLESRDRMDIGLAQAEAGDLLSGSQAILITFNKMLDPTSVVRESEYARSASGQSALETLKGYKDKILKGGAGVTLSELRSYKRFADEVVAKALESTIGPERLRISRLAERFGVDPDLIFSGRFAPQDAEPQGAPQIAPQGGVATALPAPMPQAPSSLLSQAQAAPVATGQPASKGPAPDQARIKMYAELPPAALERQAQAIAANPDDYSTAEKAAAATAWQRVFGGGQ